MKRYHIKAYLYTGKDCEVDYLSTITSNTQSEATASFFEYCNTYITTIDKPITKVEMFMTQGENTIACKTFKL
jgi:hypothetical protein